MSENKRGCEKSSALMFHRHHLVFTQWIQRIEWKNHRATVSQWCDHKPVFWRYGIHGILDKENPPKNKTNKKTKLIQHENHYQMLEQSIKYWDIRSRSF